MAVAITSKQLSAEELEKPSDEAAAENTERTRLALEAMVRGHTAGYREAKLRGDVAALKAREIAER